MHLHATALSLCAAITLMGCGPTLFFGPGAGADAKDTGGPSWMGVYGDHERHDGGNPGSFSVLMNADYYGLQADLVLRVDGGSWERHAMAWSGSVDGNSLWQLEPVDAFPAGATVDYFFHGYDDRGHELWDSDGGANYHFVVPTGGAELVASGALPQGTDLNQDLQVIFTPDEPALELELELIDQVRTARLLDSGSYAEGENPYRIRYATYNLTHTDIADALVAAQDDGVDVQVLVEADKLDADDLSSAYQLLVDGGFELVEDHASLDEDSVVSADLVGIDDSGLMHLKTRLYETPAWEALLTGSHNPQFTAMGNDETLHLIRDAVIIERYAAAYEAIRDDEPLANTWDEGAAINVLFTPAEDGVRAGTRILEWLQEEDEQILLSVFALREISAADVSGSLVDILAERVAAGVPVYVITDRKMADGVNADGSYWFSDDDTEDDLRDVGVVVFEVLNLASDYSAMHTKFAVLGRSNIRVITDASNWSYSGLGSSSSTATNVESVLFIDSEALDGGRTGRRYLARWLEILGRYDDQDTGESVGRDEVFEALSALDGWPRMEVAFAAHDAWTSWGEVISVRGAPEALGAWGPGLELGTDGDSYPTWSSGSPVDLPVGQRFGWKLCAGVPGAESVRWEEGEDRSAFVSPAALVPEDDLGIEGAWSE